MKRFRFRLENVLRLRELELERVRGELARVLRERSRRAAEVRDAEARLRRGQDQLAQEMRAGSDGDRLALRAEGIATGQLRLVGARAALRDLEPVVARARNAVQMAHRRVRSLEKLRDHQSEAHRRTELAAEESEREELARSRRAYRVVAERRHTESSL